MSADFLGRFPRRRSGLASPRRRPRTINQGVAGLDGGRRDVAHNEHPVAFLVHQALCKVFDGEHAAAVGVEERCGLRREWWQNTLIKCIFVGTFCVAASISFMI